MTHMLFSSWWITALFQNDWQNKQLTGHHESHLTVCFGFPKEVPIQTQTCAGAPWPFRTWSHIQGGMATSHVCTLCCCCPTMQLEFGFLHMGLSSHLFMMVCVMWKTISPWAWLAAQEHKPRVSWRFLAHLPWKRRLQEGFFRNPPIINFPLLAGAQAHGGRLQCSVWTYLLQSETASQGKKPL